VTIDHDSIEDRTVTIRERDSLTQERVSIDDLPALFSAKLAAVWQSPKLA
jgi:glycyl-tRNA synthetase